MIIWLWVFIGVLMAVIVALLIKIYLLHTATKEIEDAFADRLVTGTNTLIDISSHDRYMRKLADAINVQLRELRAQRQRYQQGDVELKNAVTNISHDLRTPLTAIYGYLELLEQEEKSVEAERYIGVIKDQAETLRQLMEELFRYSVIASVQEDEIQEEVVVNEVLEQSILSFYTAFREHHISPVIHISEKKVVRRLDRTSLTRVFSNLLNNVVKYSDGDLEVILSESGEITFINTASGLDEVQVGRLFERFYTVNAARKSTGLGLAIARTLVEQVQGEISAVYEEKKLKITILFLEKENVGK